MQDSGGDKNINKFDLTTKVALTKDNKGGTTATLHPQFRTMQPMRVVTIPSSSAGAQIIQTQLVPQVQTMIKQGNCEYETFYYALKMCLIFAWESVLI